MFEPSRVVTKVIEDKVRVAWDDREEKWYFSIVNVYELLRLLTSIIKSTKEKQNNFYLLSIIF